MSPLLLVLGILASPPGPARAAAGPTGGARHLEHLHPDFRARLDGLFLDARAAGVPLKLISGHRALDVARARAGRASWHAFGLAVDVNLHDQASMRTALARIGRDREKWETIGRLAEARGLTWGGRWRDDEVFHVEWHPGMRSALQGDELASLLAVAGPDGRHYTRTWPRFSSPPDAAGEACPLDEDLVIPPAKPLARPRPAQRRPGRWDVAGGKKSLKNKGKRGEVRGGDDEAADHPRRKARRKPAKRSRHPRHVGRDR